MCWFPCEFRNCDNVVIRTFSLCRLIAKISAFMQFQKYLVTCQQGLAVVCLFAFAVKHSTIHLPELKLITRVLFWTVSGRICPLIYGKRGAKSATVWPCSSVGRETVI